MGFWGVRASSALSGVDAVRLADALCRLLSDGHLKVLACAAATTHEIVRSLRGEALDKASVVLVPALGSVLVSTQRAAAEAAADTLDTIMGAADPGALLLPSVALLRSSAAGRLRALAAEKLAALLPAAYSRRPGSLLRVVLGVLCPLLEEGAAAKSALKGLVARLGEVCGREAVIASATPALSEEALARLRSLL